MRMSRSLLQSIVLHVIVFLLFLIDLPFFSWNRDTEIKQVPIVIDLKDIKISEMTNLPPKAQKGDEDKAASAAKRKIENNFTKDEAKEKAPKEQPKEVKKEESKKDNKKEEPQPKEPSKDFLAAPQPKKPKAPTVPEKKPVPSKKTEPSQKGAKKSDEKKAELANPLKSLLASVDDLEKNIGEKSQTATIKNTDGVNNMGIEGGVGGSYFSELSISEIDAIAGRLRACWNLDPGAMGIQNMVVEIKAELNKDGTVREVRIMDASRYNSDPHFRSVAESARRAVNICAPYAIFAEKYQDKYDSWKTLKLRFNPMDGGVN